MLLNGQVVQDTFGVQSIERNSKKTEFYTGLPSWDVFLHIFKFLAARASCVSKLCRKNELFLVLIRLQLGLLYEDLAYRLNVSHQTVGRVVIKWIDRYV